MDDDPIAADPKLQAIAAMLDVPIEEFLDGAAPGHLASFGECFELWMQIDSEEGRRRALRCLRDVVEANPSTRSRS